MIAAQMTLARFCALPMSFGYTRGDPWHKPRGLGYTSWN